MVAPVTYGQDLIKQKCCCVGTCSPAEVAVEVICFKEFEVQILKKINLKAPVNRGSYCSSC